MGKLRALMRVGASGSGCRKKMVCAAISAAAVVAVAGSPAVADDTWTNAGGGSFQLGGNWSAGTPGTGDNAIFNIPGNTPYIVTFAADAQTAGLGVSGAPVTFDMGGHQYSVGSSTPFSTSVNVTGGLTLTNGTLSADWSGFVSGSGASVVINNTGKFSAVDLSVQSGGELDVNAGGTLISTDGAALGGLGTSGTGTVKITGIGALWNYTATNGTLVLGQSVNTQGILNVTAGGKLQSAAGLNIGLEGSGTLTVSDVSGTTRSTVTAFSANVGWDGSGTLNVSNGALFSVSHGLWIGNNHGSTGSVTVGGASGGFNAELDTTGQIMIADNDSSTLAPGYTGQLTVNAGGTVVAGAGMVLGDTSNHIATVTMNGGTVTTPSLQLHSGTFNLGGGTLTSNGNESIGWSNASSTFNQTGGTNTVPTAGGATVTIAQPGPTYTVSYFLSGGTLQGNVVNNGRFTYTGGTFTGSLTNNAGATFAAGGNVSIGGSVTNGGKIVIASPANLALATVGSLSPAAAGGTVTVTGNYTQTAAGTLDIRIDGASGFDQLFVTGTATLAGTLEVDLLNGYVPSPGDQFPFLSAGTLSGSFAQVITSGGQFQVVPQGNGLVLTNFQPTPEPGSAVLVVICTGVFIAGAADSPDWHGFFGASAGGFISALKSRISRQYDGCAGRRRCCLGRR